MPERHHQERIHGFPIGAFVSKQREPTLFDRFKSYQVRQLEGAYGQLKVNRISNEQWQNAYALQGALYDTYQLHESAEESEPLAKTDFSLYFNNDELLIALMRRNSLNVGDLTSVDSLFRESLTSGDFVLAKSLKTMDIERYTSLVEFAKDAGLDIPDPNPNGTILLNEVEKNLDEFAPPTYGTEGLGGVVRRSPHRLNLYPKLIAVRRTPTPHLGIRPAMVVES